MEVKKHHILVAVDESENAGRALFYVGEMTASLTNVVITLLHVVREPGPESVPDRAERDDQVSRMRARAGKLLEEATAVLARKGIDQARVQQKILVSMPPSTAVDAILEEIRTGHYETVVVGRRGLSRKEEFLFGSVSSRVVHEAKNKAVWVVE
ncbi:MAG: universal stress protein [Thermodesulfobacteriota bacterium]